jgi:ATP synthase protein I
MGFIGPEGRTQLEVTARFAASGIELVAAIVVGYFGGRALDRWFETTPYCGYIGFILGVVTGFRNLFLLARRTQTLSQDSAALPPEQSKPPPNDTTSQPP